MDTQFFNEAAVSVHTEQTLGLQVFGVCFEKLGQQKNDLGNDFTVVLRVFVLNLNLGNRFEGSAQQFEFVDLFVLLRGSRCMARLSGAATQQHLTCVGVAEALVA